MYCLKKAWFLWWLATISIAITGCGGASSTPSEGGSNTGGIVLPPSEDPIEEPSEEPIVIDLGVGFVSVEAEDLALLGSSVVQSENKASSGRFVGNIVGGGDGVEFIVPQDTRSVTLIYRADESGTVTLKSASGSNIKLQLDDTQGEFSLVVTNIYMSEGETGQLVYESGDASVELDILGFSELNQEVVPWVSAVTFAQRVEAAGDGITVAQDGSVYSSGAAKTNDVIRISPAGAITTVLSDLSAPVGLDFDSQGNLYVAECRGNTVGRLDGFGNYSQFASVSGCPAGLVVGPEDDLYVTTFFSNTLSRIDQGGNVSILVASEDLSGPIGVDIDDVGNIYLANWNDGKIFRYSAGTGLELVGNTGSNINQILYFESYIYIPLPNNNRVDRMTLNGDVETFAGSSETAIVNVALERPNGAAISPDGRQLYIGESDSGRIRVVSKE